MTVAGFARRRRRVDWPTVALVILCYVVWGATTRYTAEIGLWVAVPILTLSIVLHSSLQHEVLHGHPSLNQTLNDALVFPAIGLLIPYQRFRDTHLAHHRNENLTDPYDDPESNYLDPLVWAGLPGWKQAILRFNNTLLGRMLVGPFISIMELYRTDVKSIISADAKVVRAWMVHIAGVVPVVIWLSWSSVPVWVYVICAYAALSVLKIRTFLEHRAHERVPGRSVIIEDKGPLALLFLNNNYHAVHHAHPQVSWFDLPALYRSRREIFLQRNRGYLFRSYWDVFKAHFLRAKDPVPHPLISDQ